MRTRCLCLASFVSFLVATLTAPASAVDWPTWRFDAGRGASTPEELPAELDLHWMQIMPPLKPAWPEDLRLHFDAHYEPIIAGGVLYFGASRNDSVTAVDLRSGETLWRFFAEGPVRFAPLHHKGRVYFGADDGALYCLDAKTGSLQWRFLAAPTGRKVIGSERVISVWPVRGGPVLVDGKIHFTVGVWPFEGTFLYSVDPTSGEAVELQRTNTVNTALEHDVVTLNDLTPQGYLAATDSTLFIPQGRSAVATLDRKTRRFGSYRYSTRGLTNYHVSASGRWLFHGPITYDTTGNKQISSSTRTPVIGGDVLYAADGDGVSAFDLSEVKVVEKTDRRGKKTKASVLGKLWTVPYSKLRGIPAADAAARLKASPLVVDLKAGSRIYGHQGDFLFAIDVTGEEPAVSWSTETRSAVASLVAANGHLVATTQDGQLLAYGEGKVGKVSVYQEKSDWKKARNVEGTEAQKLVERILEDQDAGDAYCVLLGAPSGELIRELLRQSKLRLVVIDPDAKRVDQLRRKIGENVDSRLVAHVGNPLEFQLPPYMASLVLCEKPEQFGLFSNPHALAELFRILRPYGGSAWLAGGGAQHAKLTPLAGSLKLASAELAQAGGHSVLTKAGALPGSADWTHEYGDASNTLMSRDRLVKAPLGVLWFGGPAADGSLFYNRHFWGPSMAVIGGRMFLQGPGKMTAVDVYTGRILWQLPLEGVAKYLPGRRGNDFEGNLAGYHFLAVEDAVYLVHGKSCLRLDPKTGDQVNEFKLQNPEDDWGRIRVIGDKLIAEVFRDIDKDKNKLPPGKRLLAGTKAAVEIVAIDRNSGSKLWSHAAEASFPVLSVGKDRVFAFDGALESFYKDWKRRGKIPAASDIRYAKAIDLETGNLIWKQPTDLIGTWMSYSGGQDVVLMSNKSSIMAVNGRTGKELWRQTSEGVGFRGHPESLWDRVIVWNDRLLDQRGPGLAWNLQTGKRVPRIHPVTKKETPWEFTKSGHHCNYAIASPHLMTFRADTAGFCDIESGNTSRLKGFRSGCRNSLIPANGVLNAPNMAHGCSCGYSLFTSLALVNLPQTEVWSYSALKFDPKKDSIRRVGINFGAPGDRQDESGTLWIDYPNKGGSSPPIPVSVTGDSPSYFRRHSSLLDGDGVKWVAGSGVEGAKSITLTLSATEPEALLSYTVRLHFTEPDHAPPGKRVFDVAIQGESVAEALDIARESKGRSMAIVREVRSVQAGKTLTVTLTPKAGRTVLSGIEVLLEDSE